MFWLTILLYAVFMLVLIPCIVSLCRRSEIVRAKAIVSACVFYTVLFWGILLLRIWVPYWAIYLTIAASFISSFAGHYLSLFYKSKIFDRGLHAFGAFSFALLFYYLLDDLLLIVGSPLFIAIFVFFLGNTLGVFFELLEFSHDEKPSVTVKSQHGLKDTDMDMLFNLFGSAAAGIFCFFTV